MDVLSHSNLSVIQSCKSYQISQILLFLFLATFSVFTFANNLIPSFEVDLNEKFQTNVVNGNGNVHGELRANENLGLVQGRRFTLEGAFVYELVENNYKVTLHALNTKTDSVVNLLAKFSGEGKSYISSLRIKPFSKNKLIIAAKWFNAPLNLYITDGTLEGTMPWAPPYSEQLHRDYTDLSSDFGMFEWKSEADEYYYTFGPKLYQYKPQTVESTLITETDSGFLLTSAPYLATDEGYQYIYEKNDRDTIRAIDGLELHPGTSLFLEKKYFIQFINNESYFSSLSADKGVIKHLIYHC